MNDKQTNNTLNVDEESDFINYLFEKGYLDFDNIIKDYVNSGTNHRSYSLLKEVLKDYKSQL